MEQETNQNNRGNIPFRWKAARLVGLILSGVAVAALFALVLSAVVQMLWNALMPELFGFKQISFWQALGLLFLGRLLLGGFGHHHRSREPRRFRKWIHDDRDERWKPYGRFWHESGERAADGLLRRPLGGDGSAGEKP